MIAMMVILFAVWVVTPPEKPQFLLLVYPLWATTAAMSFLACRATTTFPAHRQLEIPAVVGLAMGRVGTVA